MPRLVRPDPAVTKEPTLLDLLARARRSFTDRSRLTRELIIFGSAVFAGLVLMPFAIWFVGNRLLGPYTHGADAPAGGPFALFADFFGGLRSGAITYWAVVFGPAVIILVVRLAVALLRQPAPPEAPRQ